jgi:hypothetical protein
VNEQLSFDLEPAAPLTADQLLRELRARGAVSLRRIAFRDNRHRLLSVSRDGATLNAHAAFRLATPELIDQLGLFLTAGRRSNAYADAVRALRDWEGAREGVRVAAERDEDERPPRRAPCEGTPEQQAFLSSLYARLNRAMFDGLLPDDLPLRLSHRMRRKFGVVRYARAVADGQRRVIEIALNIDLFLEGNERELVDTLLHEMAHAEAWLLHAHAGHGRTWRTIAHRVRCEARSCTHRRIRRRARRRDRVTRVPGLREPARVTA